MTNSNRLLASRFWEKKSLELMSNEEWEALCDGCGRCCLHKLQDEDTEEIYFTDVACRLLDISSCRCTNYQARLYEVPECVNIRPGDQNTFAALPATCAYRLLSEGSRLPEWHYLISGSRQTVHEEGASIRDFAVKEDDVHPDDYENHIIQWVD
ncbi:YcgN family cysteine cluster protein [Aurantivibrio plasticivorans]